MAGKKYLLLEEVAAEARVSVDTVRGWLKRKEGKLPSVRPGRRRMVRQDVLEAFLEQDLLVQRVPKAESAKSAVVPPDATVGGGNAS